MSEPEVPQMNADNLYLEESFTDQTMGQIRRMTPVTANGDKDDSRAVQYIGATQFMTPAGALPVNFEIEAESLGDAASQFAGLAQKAMEDTIKELEAMRREQASQIVVPGQQSGGGIQLP